MVCAFALVINEELLRNSCTRVSLVYPHLMKEFFFVARKRKSVVCVVVVVVVVK